MVTVTVTETETSQYLQLQHPAALVTPRLPLPLPLPPPLLQPLLKPLQVNVIRTYVREFLARVELVLFLFVQYVFAQSKVPDA